MDRVTLQRVTSARQTHDTGFGRQRYPPDTLSRLSEALARARQYPAVEGGEPYLGEGMDGGLGSWQRVTGWGSGSEGV